MFIHGAMSGGGAGGVESINLQSISSVANTTMALHISAGGDYTIPLWPSSACRIAAEAFVEKVRAAQAAQRDVQTTRAHVQTESVAEQLTKLSALHDQGVITDDEFTAQKNRLLS